MATPYLTPDTFTGTAKICARLRIPDNQTFIAAVRTAVLSLTHDYEWEAFGTMTPQEAARHALDMYNEFTETFGGCMLGSIFPYATVSPPDTALPCDGASYLRTDYPELYAALDNAFIVDADHFITPDLRGKVIAGVGAMLGSYGTLVMGQTGGEAEHTLTTSELAAHSHATVPHTHSEGNAVPTIINGGLEAPAASATPGVGITGSASPSTANTGSDTPHNNIQPFLALKYAIVAR